MIITFNRSEFQACCGINVFHEMNVDDDMASEGPPNPKDVAGQLQEEIKRAQAGGWTDSGPGLLLYAVVPGQKLEIAALKQCKFRVLAKFWNPKTGNQIALYGLTISQPKRRKARKA